MDALRTHRAGKELPHLPDVERLSPNVIRILGDNPSKFTLQGTNIHLLGTGRRRILLDTGSGIPTWKSRLASVLAAEHATVSICLLSHWHHDHIGGTVDLHALCPDAKIYKNRPTLDPDELLTDLPPKKIEHIEDGQIFRLEDDGFAVRALYTPGHAKDHMVFVIESTSTSPEGASSGDDSGDKDIGAMFTGDNVVGHGTVLFEDLTLYLRSLHHMAASIGAHSRAYPAHGAVLEDGRGHINLYIRHRQVREEGILRILKTGRLDAASGEEKVADISHHREWESHELGELLYRFVPKMLRGPAEWGLVQVLTKLEADGKVARSEEGKWFLIDKAVL